MKPIRKFLAATLLAATTASPLTAHAADRDFCRAYTDEAIRQANQARQSRFCAREIWREPARWSLDPRGHFEWCRVTPRRDAEAERFYRVGFLRDCMSRR